MEPVNIPGFFWKKLDGENILTLEEVWTEVDYGDYVSSYISYQLRTVRLTASRAFALDAYPISGYPYSLEVGDGAAYLLWRGESSYTEEGCYEDTGIRLDTVSLADPANLTVSNSQQYPAYYGYSRGIQSGRLMLDSSYQGLLVYDVETDPLQPSFDQYVNTRSAAWHVRTQGSEAYASAGMYGVTAFSW